MRQKHKGHRKAPAILTAVLFLGIGILVFLNLPRPQKAMDSAYNRTLLSDGTYLGSCDNGLVQVQVEVTLKNHSIVDICIVRHQNGMGRAAEAIVDHVMERQSVEVDAVTGATMSSQTILKAIENALSGGEKK